MKKFIFAQTIFALIFGAYSFAIAESRNNKARSGSTTFQHPIQNRSASKPGLFSKLFRKATSFVGITDSRTIQYNGFLPLEEDLKDISSETGITFILANSVSDETVYSPSKTNNWKSAVKQLLSDYNTMQIWSEDLAKSRI